MLFAITALGPFFYYFATILVCRLRLGLPVYDKTEPNFGFFPTKRKTAESPSFLTGACGNSSGGIYLSFPPLAAFNSLDHWPFQTILCHLSIPNTCPSTEPQRGSIILPRVATQELPWVAVPITHYPDGVASALRFEPVEEEKMLSLSVPFPFILILILA
jgi:hypothetical protein